MSYASQVEHSGIFGATDDEGDHHGRGRRICEKIVTPREGKDDQLHTQHY